MHEEIGIFGGSGKRRVQLRGQAEFQKRTMQTKLMKGGFESARFTTSEASANIRFPILREYGVPYFDKISNTTRGYFR